MNRTCGWFAYPLKQYNARLIAIWGKGILPTEPICRIDKEVEMGIFNVGWMCRKCDTTPIKRGMRSVCPKCGFSQPDDYYCASCGVNIEKYVKKKRKKLLRIAVVIASMGFISLVLVK